MTGAVGLRWLARSFRGAVTRAAVPGPGACRSGAVRSAALPWRAWLSDMPRLKALPSAARRTAILLAAAIAAAGVREAQAAEVPPLGRLFNTPQQRAQLDAQRNSAAIPAQPPQPLPPAPPADAAPPVPPPPPAPMVLNGVVRPSHGQATVWLNQEPVPEGQRIIGRNGTVTLLLPSGQRVTLKPGQRYDEMTGEVRDDGR